MVIRIMIFKKKDSRDRHLAWRLRQTWLSCSPLAPDFSWRAVVMSQVIGCLPPTQEAWIKSLVAGFRPQLLQAFRE